MNLHTTAVSTGGSGWINSHWHSCCRHVLRRCRQTLFFCVIMTCALILFVGHAAVNYPPSSPADQVRQVLVNTAPTETEPKSTASLLVERQLPGYLEKIDTHKRQIFMQRLNNVVNMESMTVGGTASGESPSTPRNNDEPSAFIRWRTSRLATCDGRLEMYGNMFARLSKAIVDLDHCKAAARGGERVDGVLNQPEQAEYYNDMAGCFQLANCGDRNTVQMQRTYRFKGSSYLNDWLRQTKISDVDGSSFEHVDTTFTIAITRHEYANLYHTMTDWYNAYIVMRFFDKQPNETNILFVDAHPRGHLDDAWTRLFNRTYYLAELQSTRTLFSDLVWGIEGYESLIKDNFGPDRPPYMEQFRSFFLSSWGVNGLNRTLNCSSPSVLFLWRRDYVAHPRNPSGIIQRKIQNEDEILESVRRAHPDYTVNGVQIDSFGIADQLQLIADTDVLIGMHGAGLAYIVFIPLHGALVELFPSYYIGKNGHMGDLARWRGMTFIDWHSTDRFSELAGYRTRVPTRTVDVLLQSAVGQMCRRATHPSDQSSIKKTADVWSNFHVRRNLI